MKYNPTEWEYDPFNSSPSYIVEAKDIKGLIQSIDFHHHLPCLGLPMEAYEVYELEKKAWVYFADIIQRINHCICIIRKSPFSEPYFTYVGPSDGNDGHLEAPLSPTRDRARAVNLLYVIQELAFAYEEIKSLQEFLLKDTLDNLLYSNEIDFHISNQYDLERSSGDVHPEFDKAGLSTESQFMSDCYSRIFHYIAQDDSYSSLNNFYSQVYKLDQDAFRLFSKMSKDTFDSYQRLISLIREKHNNKDLIVTLLNKEVEGVLKRKEKIVRRLISDGLKCGEFTIEEKLRECYMRFNECPMHSGLIHYPETLAGARDYLVQQIAIDFDYNTKESCNHYWEFLSCIVELELLKSIKNDTPLPVPFFPTFPQPDSESAILDDNEQDIADSDRPHRHVDKLDRFILGDGPKKEANKALFCKKMKETSENDAKARYISKQINVILSGWPSYPSLHELDLVSCNQSTWSGHARKYK